MCNVAAVFSRRAMQLLMVAFLCMGAVPASANGLSPKDRKQVIEVVQAQLKALAQDDAAKAFSYAAPNIKQLLGSAENFMAMVRMQYEVVYRPSSITFMQPSGDAGAAELVLQLIDKDGDAWIATYTLQRQKNKTWRITGCTLAPATGTMV